MFEAWTRKRLLALAASSAMAFIAASLLVTLRPDIADRIDRSSGMPLATFAHRYDWVEDTARVVAALTGYPWLLLCTVVAACVLVRKGFRRPAIWIVVVSLVVALTTPLLKVAFGRPRPEYAHMQLSDFGFPSGHASNNACAAWLAILLAAQFIRSPTGRRLVAAVAVIIALGVGLDRLLLGVHGLLDVLGGYAVATLWVSLAAYLVDPSPAATSGAGSAGRNRLGAQHPTRAAESP